MRGYFFTLRPLDRLAQNEERDRGPYPVLAISGEQGTAKSTLVAILRALIDPNASPLRALPREDRELFIQANNGWLLAFRQHLRLTRAVVEI